VTGLDPPAPEAEPPMCALIIIVIIIIIIVTLLITPMSSVLLEKLTDFQLVKKFPSFYGTRMFITVFTSSHHLSVS
jgi:hypothetical protein